MSAGIEERECIDVSQEQECRYWCRKFGVRPKALKRAVRAVGPQAEAVQRYLETLKLLPNPGPFVVGAAGE